MSSAAAGSILLQQCTNRGPASPARVAGYEGDIDACEWLSPSRRWKSRALVSDAQLQMPHAQLTEAVRRQVAATFARLNHDSSEEPRESILIRGGTYCGRRFDVPGAHAIWLLAEAELQFFRDDATDPLLHETVGEVATITRLAA
jgi:hypothetical protein